MATSRYLANTYLAEKVDISEKRVVNVDYIHKFGRNPSVGGAPETNSMQGGVYSYLTSPSTVYVTSDSGNDAAGGTGARTITVEGLDGDYNNVQETQRLLCSWLVRRGIDDYLYSTNRKVRQR